MTTRRRSRRSPSQRIRAPSRTAWDDVKSENNSLASGGATALDILSPRTVNWENCTVLRMIGNLYILPSATNVDTHGVFAFYRDNDENVLLNPSDPFTDVTSWQHMEGFHLFDSTTKGTEMHRFPFDIRSMRRLLGLKATIAFVLKSANGAIEWSLFMRVLVKLH